MYWKFKFVVSEDKNYIQQSAVPRRWDSHGGEDVPVYAQGPMSHLFRGVFEQTYIPHALAFASCIGPQRDDCERRRQSLHHRQLIECPSPHIIAEDLKRDMMNDTGCQLTLCMWCLVLCLFYLLKAWRTWVIVKILSSGCVFLLVNYRHFSMLLHTNWFRSDDEETSAFILDFYSCPSIMYNSTVILVNHWFFLPRRTFLFEKKNLILT